MVLYVFYFSRNRQKTNKWAAASFTTDCVNVFLLLLFVSNLRFCVAWTTQPCVLLQRRRQCLLPLISISEIPSCGSVAFVDCPNLVSILKDNEKSFFFILTAHPRYGYTIRVGLFCNYVQVSISQKLETEVSFKSCGIQAAFVLRK